MTLLFIHTINSEYRSRDDGQDYDKPEEALAAGVHSAALLAADGLEKGKAAAAIAVRVELADGTALLRSVVMLSVARVLITSEASVSQL